MTQVPKRRLSLFSFGSNSNSVGSGSTGQTSVSPGTGAGSSSSSFGFGGKGRTLSAMSPTSLSRRNTNNNVTTASGSLDAVAGTSDGATDADGAANGGANEGTAGANGPVRMAGAVGGDNGSHTQLPKRGDGLCAPTDVAKLAIDTTAPGSKGQDQAMDGPSNTNSTNNPNNNMHNPHGSSVASSATPGNVGRTTRSSSASAGGQLHSPVSSPTMLDNELHIFERSVQDYDNPPLPPAFAHSHDGSRRPTLSRLRTKSGHNSSISLSNFKNEDYIPPALDATTSILNDNNTNLDDVDIIYCTRRNSSVLGLNMALGRSTPSRKNSVYSMNQLHQQQSSPYAANGNGATSANASFNPAGCNCSNSNSVNNSTNPCTNTIPESSQGESPCESSANVDAANGSSLPMSISQSLHSSNQHHPMSPTSPPKLSSSKSSISFYSYADMLNNDEYAKRPSFKNSYSHGFVPTRKDSVNSIKYPGGSESASPSHFNGTNSKKFNSNLNKFLISPESSDLEDDGGSKAKSINDQSINDNESLVSSTVGDCLRQTKTEISQV